MKRGMGAMFIHASPPGVTSTADPGAGVEARRLIVSYKMGGTSEFFRFVSKFSVLPSSADIVDIVRYQTCTTLENMWVRSSCPLCHLSAGFIHILRTILERNHHHISLPESLAQLHRSANRAVNSSGDERGLVIILSP
jgi:hypothetical protein